LINLILILIDNNSITISSFLNQNMSLLAELRANAAATQTNFESEANLRKFNEVIEKLKGASREGLSRVTIWEKLSDPVVGRLSKEGLTVSFDGPDDSEALDRTYIEWLSPDAYSTPEPNSLLQDLLANISVIQTIRRLELDRSNERRYHEIVEKLRVQSTKGSHQLVLNEHLSEYFLSKLRADGLKVFFDGPCKCGSSMSYGCTCDGKPGRITNTIITW
jgi:hypothetical protein